MFSFKHLLFTLILLASVLKWNEVKSQTVNEEKHSIVWQLGGREPRINVQFGTKGINIGGYEDMAPIIKNNFANELQIEINWVVTDYCGGAQTYRTSRLLKSYETYAPSPFFEGFIFNSTCESIKKYGSKGSLKSRVSTITYDLVKIEDITAKKQKEALAIEQAKKGNELLAENKLDLAEAEFKKALENMPDNYSAKSGLETVKIRREKMAANKQKVDDLVKEGNNLLTAKDLNGAESKFKSALGLDKENAEAQAGLNKVTELKKAAQDQKAKIDGHISAGNDLLAKNDLAGAEKEYNKALELDKENAQAKAGIDKVRAKQKTVEETAKKESADSTAKAEESGKASSSEETDSAESGDSDSESSSSGSSSYEEPRESAEEYAARMEKERIERMQNYHDGKKQQNEQLAAQSSAATGAQLEGALAIALLIFDGMGNDNPENIWKGNSIHFGLQLGFTTVFSPIFDNSSIEDYNGNSYSYTDKTQNGTVSTLGLEGNVEFWPLYGENFGFGARGGLSAGYFGASTSFIYDAGLKGFAGLKNAKLAFEYSIGRKSFSYTDILDSYEYGSGGTSNYNFRRFAIGPRFTFHDVDMTGTTIMNLEIMPVFELPSVRPVMISNNPLVYRWENGIRANLSFHNRMHIYLEVFPQYSRTGDIEYKLESDVTRRGTYFSAGVIRHWDFFGDAATSNSFKSVYDFHRKKNKWSLQIVSPSMNWFGVPKQDAQFFNSNINLGIKPIALEKDYNFTDNISATMSAGIHIGAGGTLRIRSDNKTPASIFGQNIPNSTDVKYSLMLAEVPIGLRFTSNPIGSDVYWFKAGISNNIIFDRSVSLNSNITEPEFNSIETLDESIKTYVPAYMLGVGTDLAIMGGGSAGLRVGVTYTSSTAKFIEELNAPLRCLTLNTGFIF